MSTSLPATPTAIAWITALIGVVSCVPLAGCIFDPDQRCGPAMIYVAAAGCVCAANAVPMAGGCRACADDEVVVGNQCGCAPGQAKNPANVCTTVAGLGDPCDTVDAPCQDATYSYCDVRRGGTSGTCTSTCTSDADCGAAYTCATWEADPYCRQFDGLGKPCSSSSDCGGDATFCDTVYTHTCFVAGCSLTADDCPRDQQCCDYTGYGLGTLCGAVCL